MKHYGSLATMFMIFGILSGCSTAGPFVTNISSDGHGNLIIEKRGVTYNGYSGQISNDEPTTTTLNITQKSSEIPKIYIAFYGRISYPSGEPIQNVTIKVFSDNDNKLGETITGEDGSYKISNLSPETYVIKVWKEGFSREIKRIKLESDKPTKVDFILKQE